MATSQEKGQKGATKPRQWPSWLDHFNSRDLKALFRCSVAAWVVAVLMVTGPSLRAIGTATFFGCLVLYIVPPSGIFFVYVLGVCTLLIGMGLAWAWGLIAMKAALAARPQSETDAKLLALQQEAARQANATGLSIPSVSQKLVYDGFMLDARVTSVYFVLVCLLIYLLARLRANNPKFTLAQIFGTIISDLFLTIGPLLPSFNGVMPKTLILPAAIGAGLGLAASLLFFPQSTSYAVLSSMQGLVQLSKLPLDFTAARLSNEDGQRNAVELKDLHKVKAKMIATYKAMEPAVGFLPLDFSRCRWNANDVKNLKKHVRQVLVPSLYLLEFHIARIGGEERLNKLRDIAGSSPVTPWSSGRSDGKTPQEVGMRQLLQCLDLIEAVNTSESQLLHLDSVEAMRQSSEEILPACQDAITQLVKCLHSVNSRRWSFRSSKAATDELVQHSQAVLEKLRNARFSFTSQATERLIQTHADIFDDGGALKPIDPQVERSLRGITTGLVLEEHVLSVADSLANLLTQIIGLLDARPQNKIWFPTSIRYAISWVFRRTARAPIGDGGLSEMDPDDTAHSQQSDEARQLFQNIKRRYGAKQRSKLVRVILGTYRWLTSPGAMYALRMVVVTIALAIPAVIPSSAGFYFRVKGIWALIMAQTTLLVYMSDFILSMMARAAGTVIGGVAGLVAWYIGSGSGPGNPYGLAAITAPVVVIFMWARLFFSPVLLQATVMSAATYFLVVGYSYDNEHIAQYGDPGVGYAVFWRRLVLVFVGFAAACVVQIFPHPPSAARHICKSLSNALHTLSDHYALLLSCWGQSDHETGIMAEQLSLELAEKLAGLDGPIAVLKLEFSSSRFDSDSLRQVQSLCHQINQSLGRLLYLSMTLPVELQDRLARSTGVLNQRGVGDVMAMLGIVAHAIKTGDPLPEMLPTPLVKRCREHWRTHHGQLPQLEAEDMRNTDYRRFCVAMNSYMKFLTAVDDLVMVVKSAVGEGHIVHRENWIV